MNRSRLLDTNIVVPFLNGDVRLVEQIRKSENLFVPSIVIGELYFGAWQSERTEQNLKRIEDFVSRNVILECDVETARRYGEIRYAVRRKGRPIPDNDAWIAAIALQHDMTLVTRDQHFREVDHLQTEMW